MMGNGNKDGSTEMCEGHGFRTKKFIFAVIVLALFVWGIRALFGSANFPQVSSSDWQAVFLTNNQVYFGHLSDYNRGYAALKDIFYLRATEPLQQGATPPGPALSLVKLGGELHGPQDTMYIPKDKIMFWENMRKDSQVVQAVSNFLAQQKK